MTEKSGPLIQGVKVMIMINSLTSLPCNMAVILMPIHATHTSCALLSATQIVSGRSSLHGDFCLKDTATYRPTFDFSVYCPTIYCTVSCPTRLSFFVVHVLIGNALLSHSYLCSILPHSDTHYQYPYCYPLSPHHLP
jgi:hypothetical protein